MKECMYEIKMSNRINRSLKRVYKTMKRLNPNTTFDGDKELSSIELYHSIDKYTSVTYDRATNDVIMCHTHSRQEDAVELLNIPVANGIPTKKIITMFKILIGK